LKHVVVPKTEDRIALRSKRSSSLSILDFTRGVLATIEFNNQSRRLTAEVRDVVADCDLPAKFQTIQAAIARPEP
jgi:hypothetical protein